GGGGGGGGLMAAGLPLPKQLVVHGYILMGDSKMSKSLGNVISPDDLATWYGVEPVRYYLMRQMPITHDGHFDLKDLENRINSDLANSLGNLLNRMQTLALNNGLQEITAPECWEAKSSHLHEMCQEAYRFYWEEMGKYHFHIALGEVWKFIALVNAYFHEMQPWVLAKQNKELFAEVIAATCNSLYSIAIMLMPIMPKKMETLLYALGQKYDETINYDEVLRKNNWNRVFKLNKLDEPLFVRPESRLPKEDEVPVAKTVVPVTPQTETPSSDFISIDDFAKCKLLVGTIISCEEVAGSDKLYKMQVDCGLHGMRQIFSGVKKNFKPEDLIGKQGIVVANLSARKMPGGVFQGILLYASDASGNHRLASVSGPVDNGTRLK
ncbi:MAG: class I tRNA ligase family protein, partial [Myxococcales bacterium]|nr:class I tRNA ligase family protein [Myxococcales bacterium]